MSAPEFLSSAKALHRIELPAATRPGRRLPHMADLARRWGLRTGICVRCGAVGRCEKAHLVTRMYGGLDTPANLAPLCPACHDEQPDSFPGEEALALTWLATPCGYCYWVKQATAVLSIFKAVSPCCYGDLRSYDLRFHHLIVTAPSALTDLWCRGEYDPARAPGSCAAHTPRRSIRLPWWPTGRGARS